MLRLTTNYTKLKKLQHKLKNKIQTLTFNSVQLFTWFPINEKIEAGFVLGPNVYKRHAVVLIDNTKNSAGFIASSTNCKTNAEFVPPRTYLVPNIFIEKTKIKYLPYNSYTARKLGFMMIFRGFKSLLTNPDNIKAVFFEKDNFSDVNVHTQKWELINKVHTPQLTKKVSFELALQPKLKNYEITNQIEILPLEKRIDYILSNYCSSWTSSQRELAIQYWLDSSTNCWFQDEFHFLLKSFLQEEKDI